MAVYTQHNPHTRSVGTDRRDQTLQSAHDLAAGRPTGRTQHGRNHATRVVEHHDRLEAVFVVMRIEQAKLLAAMHGVEGVVDVEC
jgi:hypothetical protein